MKNKLLLGNIIAFVGYLIWGFLPLYWGLLHKVPSFEIIAHRIILSLLVLGLFLLILKKPNVFQYMKDKRTRRHVIVAGVILVANWSAFIIAVLANRVVECSLAYYINPLIVIAFGMLFFKESAGWLKILAMGLALIGVLILAVGYDKFPIYALTMALTFSIYGVVKKRIQIDPYIGLFLEMLVMLPVAIGIEIFFLTSGTSVYFGGIDSVWFLILLLLAGFLTMLPLVLYNTGINMISLGNMGFLQFIAPTIMFAIGVFINHEPFTKTHLYSFIFIWVAVIVYCVNLALTARRQSRLLD